MGLIFQRAYFCEEKAKGNCYWDFSVVLQLFIVFCSQ